MSHPVAIIQARIGSTRLRGKVLLPLCGSPMLWHIVQRCRAAEGIADVVVATTDQPADDAIVAMCTAYGIPCFRGSEHDVLDRYYQAALAYGTDPVIRVTGDCPLVMPDLITNVLRCLEDGQYDLVGVNTGAGASEGWQYPDGVDTEGFTQQTLWWLWRFAPQGSAREHVSPYAWHHPDYVRIGRIVAPEDLGAYRWTVDHAEDYALVKHIYDALWQPDRHFTLDDVVEYLAAHSEICQLNREHVGAEGYEKLWAEIE